jgi:riboflavin kinase/FMN adenylyltransferase
VEIHTDFNRFKNKKTVVTIGTFDGVHIGHQTIIDRLKEAALRQGAESVILTFYPHPRMILHREDHGLQLLTTPEEKAEKLKESGVQHLMVYPFSEEFSRISAYDYVRNLLVTGLNAAEVIVGYDHRFGRNREGDFSTLTEWAEMLGFTATEIPAKEIDAVNVSSTKIRQCLLNGDIETANAYLGYNYTIKGTVIHGAAMGRTIGFPTANIHVDYPYKLIPGNGVYAIKAQVHGKQYFGIMNIGVRPTVDAGTKRHLEAHLFDFDNLIYDEKIEVSFLYKVRDEKKFGSIDALKAQISVDIQNVKMRL